MRRLLLLGGSRYLIPVIDTAHELGCYVITCDYLPNNIAHKYADEYCNVDIVNKDATLEVAKRLKIDGIMSFACDPGVIKASYVAEELGLSTCGPYESVCILQNKKYFRTFLKKHGFNVPFAKGYNRIEDALDDANIFPWPVIVKPVDSAGSKGVRKVDSIENLETCIQNALYFSQKKEFIIEEFLSNKGFPSDSECFSVDGELKFVSYSSQGFDAFCSNPYTPAFFCWPPTITDKHQKELTKELQRLIKLLNMKTSIYNVETRECEDGKAYIMECSPRGGGNRLAEMIRFHSGVDLIKYAVLAALGESIPPIDSSFTKEHWMEIILHGRKSGKYKGIRISDKINPYIVEHDLWIQPGDFVESFSGANKAIGTLVLKFDNADLMKNVMSDPYQYVTIEVE